MFEFDTPAVGGLLARLSGRCRNVRGHCLIYMLPHGSVDYLGAACRDWQRRLRHSASDSGGKKLKQNTVQWGREGGGGGVGLLSQCTTTKHHERECSSRRTQSNFNHRLPHTHTRCLHIFYSLYGGSVKNFHFKRAILLKEEEEEEEESGRALRAPTLRPPSGFLFTNGETRVRVHQLNIFICLYAALRSSGRWMKRLELSRNLSHPSCQPLTESIFQHRRDFSLVICPPSHRGRQEEKK